MSSWSSGSLVKGMDNIILCTGYDCIPTDGEETTKILGSQTDGN
jgi:hypothetical protein